MEICTDYSRSIWQSLKESWVGKRATPWKGPWMCRWSWVPTPPWLNQNGHEPNINFYWVKLLTFWGICCSVRLFWLLKEHFRDRWCAISSKKKEYDYLNALHLRSKNKEEKKSLYFRMFSTMSRYYYCNMKTNIIYI